MKRLGSGIAALVASALLYGCATTSDMEKKFAWVEAALESPKKKKSAEKPEPDILSYQNQIQSSKKYIVRRDGQLYVFRESESENYRNFRSKAKPAMQKLLKKTKPWIRATVKDGDLEEIITGIYDSSLIFPDLNDLRYAEIAKLYHESGFMQDPPHKKGEKGVGAVSVFTGKGILRGLKRKINTLKKDLIKKLNSRTQKILRYISIDVINQQNIGNWLAKNYIFNILCSMYYDYENLNFANGNVHLMIKTYQRGKGSKVETPYLGHIKAIYKDITGEPLPNHVLIEKMKKEMK